MSCEEPHIDWNDRCLQSSEDNAVMMSQAFAAMKLGAQNSYACEKLGHLHHDCLRNEDKSKNEVKQPPNSDTSIENGHIWSHR